MSNGNSNNFIFGAWQGYPVLQQPQYSNLEYQKYLRDYYNYVSQATNFQNTYGMINQTPNVFNQNDPLKVAFMNGFNTMMMNPMWQPSYNQNAIPNQIFINNFQNRNIILNSPKAPNEHYSSFYSNKNTPFSSNQLIPNFHDLKKNNDFNNKSNDTSQSTQNSEEKKIERTGEIY